MVRDWFTTAMAGRSFVTLVKRTRGLCSPSGTYVSQTAFSPDGRSLAAWFGEYGGIKRMEISGGAPVPSAARTTSSA